MRYTTDEERQNLETWGEQNRKRNRMLQGVSRYKHSQVDVLSVITSSPPYGDPNWRWGIDIAGVWDGIINPAMFKMNGGSFVIVKAKDGTIDGKYIYENVSKLMQENIPFAVYLWLYPNSKVSCKSQGLAWAEICKLLRPKKAYADYEWTSYGGAPANPNSSDLLLAKSYFEQSYGQELGTYSAPGYLADHPLPFPVDWIAQYGVSYPSLGGWNIWQQSDRWGPAANWGINPDWSHVTDGDVMTPDKFTEIFGGTEPPPPGGDVTKIIQGMAVGTVNIRKAPAGDPFVPPRYLTAGSSIEATETGAPTYPQWLHLSKINGTPVTDTEWTSAGASQQYIKWSWVDVPEPPQPQPTGTSVVGATVHMSDGTDVELVVK